MIPCRVGKLGSRRIFSASGGMVCGGAFLSLIYFGMFPAVAAALPVVLVVALWVCNVTLVEVVTMVAGLVISVAIGIAVGEGVKAGGGAVGLVVNGSPTLKNVKFTPRDCCDDPCPGGNPDGNWENSGTSPPTPMSEGDVLNQLTSSTAQARELLDGVCKAARAACEEAKKKLCCPTPTGSHFTGGGGGDGPGEEGGLEACPEPVDADDVTAEPDFGAGAGTGEGADARATDASTRFSLAPSRFAVLSSGAPYATGAATVAQQSGPPLGNQLKLVFLSAYVIEREYLTQADVNEDELVFAFTIEKGSAVVVPGSGPQAYGGIVNVFAFRTGTAGVLRFVLVGFYQVMDDLILRYRAAPQSIYTNPRFAGRQGVAVEAFDESCMSGKPMRAVLDKFLGTPAQRAALAPDFDDICG